VLFHPLVSTALSRFTDTRRATSVLTLNWSDPVGGRADGTGVCVAAASIDKKVVAIHRLVREGLGLAIATMLHRRGARVAIGDIDGAAADIAGSRLGLGWRSPTLRRGRTHGRSNPSSTLSNNGWDRSMSWSTTLGIISVGPAIDETDDITRAGPRGQPLSVSMIGTKLVAARIAHPPQRTHHQHRLHQRSDASTGDRDPTRRPSTPSLGFTDAIRLENRRSGIHFSTVSFRR